MAHALENVLQAASLLKEDPDILFLLVGDGASKQALVQQAEAMKLSNVVLRSSMPKTRMPDLWSVCDVALVHLKNDPVFASVIPSKIFEAFGMGKPLLIVQPEGEAADIVRAAAAGEWIEPENPEALAQAVKRLSRDGPSMRTFAENSAAAAQFHSRDRLAAEMLAALTGLSAAPTER
jgi:glycosyltransferase involved in cell wall biosynthesis